MSGELQHLRRRNYTQILCQNQSLLSTFLHVKNVDTAGGFTPHFSFD